MATKGVERTSGRDVSDLDHERKLVDEARAGDADAFATLVARHDRKVYAMALAYTRSREDALDIYQEVFLRAFRALPRFRFQCEFSTWLHRIAANACLSFRQRRSGHAVITESLGEPSRLSDPAAPCTGETDLASPEASVERRVQSSQIAAAIEAGLGGLSPHQRLVFVLRFKEGLKLREIADAVGCAEGTAKAHLFQATERMRAHLRGFV